MTIRAAMHHRILVLGFALICTGGGDARADTPIRGGDRIAIVGNTFADQLRIHGFVETLLLNHTPDNPVSVRNLGWAGDTLTIRNRPTNFPTEESTLTAHQTDVIIACFGMGESFAGEAGIDAFKTDLRSFRESHAGKRYNGQSEVRLILVSPIAYEDLGELTPAVEERNRDLEAYTAAMREVAREENLSFVDLFTPSRNLTKAGIGPPLTTNGIHLNRHGRWALSHSFVTQLLGLAAAAPESPWQIRIDAVNHDVQARGLAPVEVFTQNEQLTLVVSETTAPSLPPPHERPLPPEFAQLRDRLIVDNLSPGTYQLTIDGQLVASASHEAWAQGVAIDSSPAHQAAENYRAAVNDKNLQFTYSWKALNQVHIVGERRHSPSGAALPGEVVEFNELTDRADERLRPGLDLKTRTWRLTPINR